MTRQAQTQPVALEGWARDLLAVPRFATLAVMAGDGWPLQAVVWYDLRDEGILVNSAVGRRWPSILRQERRASLLVHEGHTYVAIRALAEVRCEGEEAQADIAALAHRYLDEDAADDMVRDHFRAQQRVSFLLRPVSVFAYGRPGGDE